MAVKDRIESKHLDMLWNSAAVSHDVTLLTSGPTRNPLRSDLQSYWETISPFGSHSYRLLAFQSQNRSVS